MKSEARIEEKAIILDTIKSEVLSPEDAKKLDDIYDNICNILGYDNVIMKVHPRDKNNKSKIKKYLHTSIPFEYIKLESNIERKLLITLSSTAVVMPKILFNQEPAVILLYKLFNLKLGERDTRDSLYINCKSMYQNKAKFLIPKNMEELKTSLVRLKGEL